MAEPWDGLLLLFPDNDQGLITAQNMRTQVGVLEGEDNENAKIAELDVQIFPALQANEVMRWLGVWDTAGQAYLVNDVVRDGNWLMMANKDTTDRPAPEAVGDAFYVYQGVQGSNESIVAKSVFSGNRYSFNNAGYITGYRIDVVAGNDYEVLTVKDPLGAGEVTFINSFTATVTGWRVFGLVPQIVAPGQVFDLLCIASEPDPTPTEFAGLWEYQKPQNNIAPTSGVILQANTTPSVLNVSKIDNSAGDRSVELEALTAGDKIRVGITTWSIQNTLDQGAYMTYTVAPAVRDDAVGVQTFTFETVAATPISYHKDLDYWLTTPFNVEGLFVANDSYENVVPDDSAYGTDLQVQDANVSADWDILAVSEGVAGQGADIFNTLTYNYSKTVGFTVPSTTYSEVDRLEVSGIEAGTYEIRFSWTSSLDSINTSQFFRYSTDGGATWIEFIIEPSDSANVFPFTYFYPTEQGGGDFELIFQARKQNGGDTMTIDYLDLILARVG